MRVSKKGTEERVKDGKDGKAVCSEAELYTRLSFMEQTIEGIGSRLSAVERRISAEDPGFKIEHTIERDDIDSSAAQPEQSGPTEPVDGVLQGITESIQMELEDFGRRLYMIEDIYNQTSSESLKTAISAHNSTARRMTELGERVERIEKLTGSLNIGRVMIPIDVTGIIAAAAMMTAAALIITGNFEMLKDALFPLAIGISFIIGVLLKLYFVNKNRGTDEVEQGLPCDDVI